jgi:hypothetical protein
VPPDLRAICAKCLKPATKERYEDAAQLAADLESFIDGTEVKARPRGRVERFLRLVSGHPVATLAVALSVIVLILLVALAFMHNKANKAQQAHKRADDALKQADDAREALEYKNREVLSSLNTILAMVSGDDMLGKDRRLHSVRREILKALEAVVQWSSGDPDAKEELAHHYEKIGRILAQLSKGSEGIIPFGEAATIWKGLAEEAGDGRDKAKFQHREAQMYLEIGRLLQERMFDLAEAQSKYNEALALWIGLMASYPCDEYLQHFAEVTHQLASLAEDNRNYTIAEEKYLQAIAVRRKLVDRNRDAPEHTLQSYEKDLARSLGYLGDLYIKRKNLFSAKDYYDESHKIRERLAKANSGNPSFRFQLARSWQNKGRLAWEGYDLDTAIKSYQDAEKIQDELVKRFGYDHEFKGDLQLTKNYLAELTIHLGHQLWAKQDDEGSLKCRQEAIAYLNKARDLGKELANEDRQDKGTPFEQSWTEVLTAKLDIIAKPKNATAALKSAMNHLQKGRAPLGPLDNYRMATLHALLAHCDGGRGDEADRAVHYLRIASELGFANLRYLEGDRSFEVLRSRTDFKVFLRAMKNEK